VVNLRRTLGHCYLVNGIAVRRERCGTIARRHPPSWRNGHCAEAGDKAAQAEAGGEPIPARDGGKAIQAGAGRSAIQAGTAKPSCISPAIANRSDTFGWDGVDHGEVSETRAGEQQLRRWLRHKLQARQPALEWMFRLRRRFLDDLQKHPQLQDLL
jgi:hypothetical protein